MTFFATTLFLAHLLGVLSSFNALLSSRTSQGTIAWILSLNALPLVAVPLYWVLGRDRFKGYVQARRALSGSNSPLVKRVISAVKPYEIDDQRKRAGEALASLPYLSGNEVELLIDGENTFHSIIEGIKNAKKSVLVQFYIVHADGLGNRLKDAMIERARAGVTVCFLYDEIGSASLPSSYVKELREAGAEVSRFHTTKGRGNRFQLNFRNHRKIVVVDSSVGWVGGHNVGDEYLGLDPKIGPWRDTHMRLSGPSVLGLMVSFAEDWKWATSESLPEALWNTPVEKKGDATVLILPTGPADRLESASLMYQQAIQSAEKRLWIASPYFVPDQAVTHALHLAALRGVDVRLIIPDKPDSKLVYYTAYALLGPLLESGVRVYRHLPGFMHQKVFLVDDRISGVGTANFDNRSFRLNFEVMGVVSDQSFAQSVEKNATCGHGEDP